MTEPRLYLNHLADLDWLIALEYGRVDDAQPPENWRGVSEAFGFLHDGPHGPAVGFKILDFSEFDADDDEVSEIWAAPRFDAPTLGLKAVTAGEIVLAARSLFDGQSSVNREFFSAAINAETEEARALWLACLQAGDAMAHFGLGYTLYELERFPAAYRHLRHYTEIAPCGSWNWCWLGKAAEAIGETAEARTAYERALALESNGDQVTNARELLEQLDGGAEGRRLPEAADAACVPDTATTRDHLFDIRIDARAQRPKDPRALNDDALLDELGRQDIERAIGDAVEGEEDGWCNYLDAELSEDEDDADWAADELLEWRLRRLRKAGPFLVALVEGEFQLTHPTEDYTGRGIILELGLVLERSGSGWSVPVCEPLPTGVLEPQLSAALSYAVEHHDGQTRKGTAIPYVSHVLAVAALVMEMEPDAPAEAIGALLHDVVEDSGGMERAQEIAQHFGLDVLRIVLSNSDTAIDPKPPWRQRKEDYLAAMADKEPDELRVSLADKLHNARAILQELGTGGEDVWTRFNAGPDEVLWYYRQLADRFMGRRDALGPAGAAVAEELDRVVSAIHDLAHSA